MQTGKHDLNFEGRLQTSCVVHNMFIHSLVWIMPLLMEYETCSYEM